MSERLILAGARPPVPQTVVARAAVIAAAGVFGLGYSLSSTLIALVLSDQGYSETTIGLNAAMHAAGVLLVAPLLPALAARFSGRSLMTAALVGTDVLLLLIGAWPSPWLSFPLRLGLGACAEVLFVLSEIWVNRLSDEGSRGRAMAGYMAAMSLGFAGGPILLSALGSAGMLPFAVGAAISLSAVVLVMVPRALARGAGSAGRHGTSLWRTLRLAPVAMASTALNAALEAAGLSFLPLYAVGVGWSEGGATRLTGTLMAGAIVLQLPIGWLADRMDRRRLAVLLALAAGAGAAVWPFVLHAPLLAYPALFVWGGLFVGIYTTVLAIVGSRFHGDELVGIYAVSGLVWGVGATAGPTLVGATSAVTAHALPLVAATSCLAFAAFARWSRHGA